MVHLNNGIDSCRFVLVLGRTLLFYMSMDVCFECLRFPCPDPLCIYNEVTKRAVMILIQLPRLGKNVFVLMPAMI